MARFTGAGAYSKTSSSACPHARSATPRACPSLAAACASFAKNRLSTLASAGACASMASASPRSISTSRSARGADASVWTIPCATWTRRVPRGSTTPQPKCRVPGSSPMTLFTRAWPAPRRRCRSRRTRSGRRLGRPALRQGDDALALERPRGRTRGAEDAVVLLEDLPNLGDRAVAVVRHRLDEKQRPLRPGALVDDLVVVDAFELARAALHGPVDRVGGHGLTLCVGDRLAKAGVAARVTPAHARGDGDLPDQLGERLAPLRVERPLLVLDGGPLRMAAHVRKTA